MYLMLNLNVISVRQPLLLNIVTILISEGNIFSASVSCHLLKPKRQIYKNCPCTHYIVTYLKML